MLIETIKTDTGEIAVYQDDDGYHAERWDERQQLIVAQSGDWDTKAEAIAAASGHHTISLIAEDTHQDALRLYTAKGYRQIARRPVVKDDWAVDASEWILFTKSVGAT